MHQKDADFEINKKVIDDVVDTIDKKVKINHTMDVPYIGGTSKDLKTVYIDRDFPRYIQVKGKKVDIYRYIPVHELVERSLMDDLGLGYEFAHQVAEIAERASIEADGIDWEAYEKVFEDKEKDIEDKIPTKIPANLYTEPYKELGDLDLVNKKSSK